MEAAISEAAIRGKAWNENVAWDHQSVSIFNPTEPLIVRLVHGQSIRGTGGVVFHDEAYERQV